MPKRKLTKAEITTKAHLNVPNEYKQKYIDILYNLKDNNPVYRKQFKIPEAHQNFIEQSIEEWLKLCVVKCSNSVYSSPIFCVPKK